MFQTQRLDLLAQFGVIDMQVRAPSLDTAIPGNIDFLLCFDLYASLESTYETFHRLLTRVGSAGCLETIGVSRETPIRWSGKQRSITRLSVKHR